MWQRIRTIFCLWLPALLGIGLAGCASPKTLSSAVDDACGGSAWREQGGLFAKVKISPAGGPAFKGEILYRVATRSIVVQRLYDGALEQVGYGDDGQGWTRAVPFDDVETWAQLLVYVSFLPTPFDLSRKGMNVRELSPINRNGQTYRVGLITRSPQDKWAICVSESDRIPRALIPLASDESAIQKPRGNGLPPLTIGYAVAYEEFSSYGGVTLPARWSIWNWNSRQGVTGSAPLATVEISEPAFVGLSTSDIPEANWSAFDVSGRWWR